MSQKKMEDVNLLYKCGMQFLESRRATLPETQKQTTDWSKLATLGGDKQAKMLRDQLATKFAMSNRDFLKAIKLAAAVETIVANCGTDARTLLRDGKYPQTAKDIMALARTSDTRQRYRVDGVRAGRFRSVKQENCDVVFDTVSFDEVPKRLSRSRGKFSRLPARLKNGVPQPVLDESRRLSYLCRKSAVLLQNLVSTNPQQDVTIPKELHKDILLPALDNARVRTVVTGLARQMLRLTIKSVWDFPEMCNRGILPTDAERQQTIQETEAVIAIADEVLQQ